MIRSAVATAILSVAMLVAGACGTDPPCPGAALPALDENPAWAVVTSDFTSTAVALLDADGALLDEAWVDSGSAAAGIAAALSGDVVLPSAPLAAKELTVIDRFGVDIVSRFDLERGGVIAQLRTQLDPSAGGGGFRANPQDVLQGDGAMVVSRSAPNLDPEAPELDRGNDLVLVDESGPLSRIALGALDVDVGGVRVYARPGRMAHLGDEIVVGLGRLDADFRVAGAGAVAVVRRDRATVAAIELPGLTNCGEARRTPDGDAVIVLCAGDTFTDDVGRRARAGVARIIAGPSGAELAEIWRAADHPTAPVPAGAPIPLGGTRIAITSIGEGAVGDRLAVLDLASAEIAIAYEADDAFVLGAGAYGPMTSLLLVPDAGVGVLRFRVDGTALTALEPTPPSPCRGLAPREVSALIR